MRWFARTEQLLGPEALEKLKQSRVAIMGLGGVGSYVCEALARAGVGYLRLVDFDVVNTTNLNRQLLALRSTLGQAKVELAAQRVMDINPDCFLDPRRIFLRPINVHEVLDPPLDLVVDAIDALNSKIALIKTASEQGFPVLTSLGAGNRLDGGQIVVGDLFESKHCPMGMRIRKRLRKNGLRSGIRCVYSLELVTDPNPPSPEDVEIQEGVGRKRLPVGSISYMPALFGLRMAEEAIRILLSKG